MEKNLSSFAGHAPGGQDRLAPLARADPLRDAVDEQVGDVIAAKIADGELLIVLPQPLTDFRDRGAGEKKRAVVIAERVLDVAHAEAASQHLHRKILQRLAPALQPRTDLRAERLVAARDLRSRVFHRPFGGLHPPGAVAVAIAAAGIAAALVVIPAKSVAALRLQRLLDDQTRRQTHQLAAGVRRRQTALDQFRKGLARAHRSG